LNPYTLRGKTCLSLSGGRTSAFMLAQVLEANPDRGDLVVCFANTGREHPATLDFVRDIGERWGVPIVWLEYRRGLPGFEVVDHATAGRHGEPYAALIRKKKYLPRPTARFCTSDLKIRPMARYLRDVLGWPAGYDMLLGIRADEPRRVSKMRGKSTSEVKGAEILLPLAEAGVDVQQVGAFWQAQAFDLHLRAINGRTTLGNCDACFLKGAGQVYSIITTDREVGLWWAEQEQWVEDNGKPSKHGARFRLDRPGYREMLANGNDQSDLFPLDDDDQIDCFCGA
jgi:3'-phosphoadenosine 5'-phosphosulfate sulfotransferase (PAPS reductase)/FAD synthetase